MNSLSCGVMGMALGLLAALAPEAPARQIEVPDWENSVRLRLLASQDRARPGDQLELAVEAHIDPGYHLYGPKERKPNRTEIAAQPDAGLSFGEPVFPAAISRDLAGLGKYELYEGRVAFRIPLTVDSAAEGRKALQVQVKVTYQVCTDYACSAPTSRTLSLTVPLAPPGEPIRRLHPAVFSTRKAS